MIAVLLFAQTDATGRTISWIVFALVAVAAALALLTAWYWRVTDPAKRQESAKGGRGPRRRRDAEPDPEPNPAPVGDLNPPVIPQSSVPSTEPPTDNTRVLTRSDILEPKISQPPQIIDLRADEPEVLAEPTIAQGLETAADVVAEETVVDLIELEAQPSQTDHVPGAHDSGIDFNDWLALAEEDS